MKERPILFSAAMVQAILDGRKTQTRRVVKPQPEISEHGNLKGEWLLRPLDGLLLPKLQDIAIHCPYGQPGDRLWVRETWAPHDEHTMRQKNASECYYRADDETSFSTDGKWRPSIHMPRWASRITLEVTGVCVERLQAISWGDAIAEGIRDPRRAAWRVDPVEGCVAKYRELWDSLNASRGAGWDVNPWVWVVEFRRLGA
jgi:hypothetical protein